MRGYRYPTVAVGEVWGAREKPRTRGLPLRPVEIVKLGPEGSKSVLVRRRDDEYVGLEEWVKLSWLVVPWSQATDFVADEKSRIALWGHAGRTLAEEDWAAAGHLRSHLSLHSLVNLGYGQNWGVTEVHDLDTALLFLGRGLDDLLSLKHARVTRAGAYLGPWEVGVALVKSVAQSRAQEVESLLTEEMRGQHGALRTGWLRRPGQLLPEPADPEDTLKYLPEYENLHATIRVWLGLDPLQEQRRVDATSALTAEVDRLRKIIEDTAWDMEWRKQGRRAKALRRRVLEGPLPP